MVIDGFSLEIKVEVVIELSPLFLSYFNKYSVQCHASYLMKKREILDRFDDIALAGDVSHASMSD